MHASLTDKILFMGRKLLLAGQVVEEQLDVRLEASNIIIARPYEAVHLHPLVVPEVQVEVVSCDGGSGDWRPAVRDGPYTTNAAEPAEC